MRIAFKLGVVHIGCPKKQLVTDDFLIAVKYRLAPQKKFFTHGFHNLIFIHGTKSASKKKINVHLAEDEKFEKVQRWQLEQFLYIPCSPVLALQKIGTVMRPCSNTISLIMKPQGYFMKRKAIALLSGGLDSTLAVKMMLDMGISVEALNFTSPFCNCTGKNSGCKSEAVRVAQEFDIPIKVVHKGLDYLQIVRNPSHGYGKGVNPCVDCRIYLLRKAKEYMLESGADFIITGEVLGQRPMSQRYDTLRLIERESGLDGLLLRPLSAQHFEPTIPEKEGWVDRGKLLAIKGRSRKDLFNLAEELDVKNYPCPAGGCLLTELSFVPKIKDIFEHSDELNLRDFRLLKIGRHFRIGDHSKVIIGRNEADNNLLEAARQPEEAAITWLDGNTPVGIVIGVQSSDLNNLAARILLRYTKAVPGTSCRFDLRIDNTCQQFSAIHNLTEANVESFLVA
jgi:tRNA U34 2-thiouridine synthase MnmA/TrmU